MKRRYKFLIWLAIIWALAIFPIWLLIPWPKIASANVMGLVGALAIVVGIVGSLIWVVSPNSSN